MINISSLTSLLLLNYWTQTQALAFQTPKHNASPKSIESKNRRTFVTNTLAIFTSTCVTTICTTNQAQALQERNEALCGTGFFEHFNEFKCTPIGDISDEGNTKKLSDNEVERVDSLMGKLGMMDVEIVEDTKNNKANDKNDRKSRKEKDSLLK